jgi:hypothetical protein
MNNGKLEYEVSLKHNAAGGLSALTHVKRIHHAYVGLGQFLRGDLVGAINSANNAMRGFSASMTATLGKIGGLAGAAIGGWQIGKAINHFTGVGDKIAAGLIPIRVFNAEIKNSLEQLRAINAAKLDAVTKELTNMGEEARKAAEHTLNLINMKNQANAAKAGTPSAQYESGQSGSIDVMKQLERQRERLVSQGTELESEWLRRNNAAQQYDALQQKSPRKGKDAELTVHYMEERDKNQTAANDLVPAMVANKQALEEIISKMDVVGANMIKASREMSEKKEADKKSAADAEQKEIDEWSAKRDADNAAQEEAAYARQEELDEWSAKYDAHYAAQEQAEKDAEDAANEAQAQYKYSRMTPGEKLAETEKKIAKAESDFAGEKDSQKREAIRSETYRTLLPERDKLQLQIEGSADDRAAKIQAARDNIAGASQRRVGGSSIGDIFTRANDLRHGRSPTDSAALQTAQNTKIIADNITLLKDLGAVQ